MKGEKSQTIVYWQFSKEEPAQDDDGKPVLDEKGNQVMTEASINLARDGELVRLLSKANFHKIFIGIETPSTDSLKECGKKQNVATDFSEAIKTLHQNGLQVMPARRLRH